MNKIDRILYYALVISFIFINETTIQWLLAIHVGGMGVTEGFNDAFKYLHLVGTCFLAHSGSSRIQYYIFPLNI